MKLRITELSRRQIMKNFIFEIVTDGSIHPKDALTEAD